MDKKLEKNEDVKHVLLAKPFRDAQAFLVGGSRKGAKQYQEDSLLCWKSPTDKVLIGGVWDGHGGFNGLLASTSARDVAKEYFDKVKDDIDNWSLEDWRANLTTLFNTMHWAIRDKFLADNPPGAVAAKSRRYIDEKGIVRNPGGDPIHGGTTCTLAAVVLTDAKRRTIITANVGDSTSIVLPADGKWDFLSVDHGPENPDEFQRVEALSAEQYPQKLLFVYDKTSVFRKYECPTVFLPSGKKDPKFVANPWGNGLHPTNVRYEPAVYAVTPKQVTKDSTCIAMTRALGDFYAHQFGLTNVPDISFREISPDIKCDVHVASDGIWDCWKYQDYQDFTNGLVAKGKDITQVCDIILDESIQRAITNFGAKHFDDASLVTISLPGSVPSKGEKEKAEKAEKPSEAAKS